MEKDSMLKDRFDLNMSLLRTNRRKNAADAALRQAKYDLREAQQAQTLYGSTVRSFLDKLTGKREEEEAKLRHSVQFAEANLIAVKRAVSAAEEELQILNQADSTLPLWEDLKTSQNENLWYRFEVQYCAEVLLPLLEISHELLVERRNQAGGANAGQIKTHHEIAGIYTAPEKAGAECAIYIQRIQVALHALGMKLPVCTYYENPSYYLNAATQYTRFDQLNKAISQTEALLHEIPILQKKLQ